MADSIIASQSSQPQVFWQTLHRKYLLLYSYFLRWCFFNPLCFQGVFQTKEHHFCRSHCPIQYQLLEGCQVTLPEMACKGWLLRSQKVSILHVDFVSYVKDKGERGGGGGKVFWQYHCWKQRQKQGLCSSFDLLTE